MDAETRELHRRLEAAPDDGAARAALIRGLGRAGAPGPLRELLLCGVTGPPSRLEAVLRSSRPLLVVGERGTPRERVARLLHAAGVRRGRFRALALRTLPRDRVAGELFGDERREAGGTVERVGAIEAASTGTLFLDDVEGLERELRARLAGVVGDPASGISPSGGRGTASGISPSRGRGTSSGISPSRGRAARVRFILGAARPLRLETRVPLEVVRLLPLRERAGEIPLLLERLGATPADAILRALVERPWPGNDGELEATVARARAVGWDRALDPENPRSAPG